MISVTPSRGSEAESLLSRISVILLIACLLKGYTNILVLISGDMKMNSTLLTQPWPVIAITCTIWDEDREVIMYAKSTPLHPGLYNYIIIIL